MVANVCTTSSGRLFVMDRNSKQRYLVDTGSNMCVYPRRLLPGHRERTDYNLYAANGTIIPTYGWASRNLNLGLHRDFTWRFVIADVDLPIIGVDLPIIGVDLLSHYGLLVDCRNNRLLDGVTSLSTPGLIAPLSVPRVKVITGGTPPDRLMEEFLGLIKPAGSHHKIQHNTSHPHNTQPTCSLPLTPPGTRPLGRCQGRVRRHAAGRHCQTRRGPMVVRPPSHAKEGQQLEALWRLLSP